MPPILRLLAITFLTATAVSADTQSITVTVPMADTLAITFPAAWQHDVIQPTPELPPTVKLTTTALSLQITFIPDPQGRFATKDDVDRTVTGANQRYVAGSVEKRLTLTQLTSTHGHGCYSTFTDADLAALKTLPPGQFRSVASGVLVINKQAATFTLLSNDTTSPEYRRAIQVITDGIISK